MRRRLPFKGHEGCLQCHSGWQGRQGWDRTNGNLFWQVIFWVNISWMIWICFLDVFSRWIFFEAGPWPASAPKRFTHLPCPVTCVQNIFAKKHNLKNTQGLKVTYCRNTSYKYLIHLLLSGCKVFLPAMLSSLSILGSSSTALLQALLQNLNGGFSQQWSGFMWNEHFLRSEASLILR